MEMAAVGLRSLHYKRVLFSLVDPRREWINGVLDDSYDPSVRVDEMTRWRLDYPKEDLQPYVIQTRQPKVIEDARQEPLANQKVVLKANIKAMAIVPILNPADVAIGTIHVEREDSDVPSPEEVEDLKTFGRHLAIVIEQSEQVNLLQSALNKVPDPVLIVDPHECIRFANQPAEKLLGVRSGWHTRDKVQRLGEEGTSEIRKDLRVSLNSHPKRVVRNVRGVGSQPDYCGVVHAENIQDWRNKTIGALLHIQDLRYLYRVLEAFRTVAEATDTSCAMQAMLKAIQFLGHRWGRLYLIDQLDPDVLVSECSFGFDNAQDRLEFDCREIRLHRRSSPPAESWRCIEEKMPLVFCWLQESPDEFVHHTSHGLQAINVNPARCPSAVQKAPGDYWIDFPLLMDEEPLGKLTLQCDEDLLPEKFELLKVLAGMYARLLSAFARRDRAIEERERWVREVAELALGLTSHSIGNCLAALPVVLERYKLREQKCPEVKELNNQFKYIMEETLAVIRRSKELLSPVHVHPERFDLRRSLDLAFRSVLPDDAWTVTCGNPSVEVEADKSLVEIALTELIQNSSKAAHDRLSPEINVTLNFFQRNGHNWLRIFYCDKGPGIPQKYKHRIFEPFFTHWPGQKVGTGLGLVFVRRVVEAHGGTISEQGVEGRGVKFVIEIPQCAATRDGGREEADVALATH
jgi:signal transduction histidine kinase/PAS domain-containing protein